MVDQRRTEDAPPAETPAQSFARNLAALTPRTPVVPTIVAANLVVFGVMVASGVHFLEPTSESLLAWGANFGPRTTSGQWWRLFTCTFVHIGIFHLLLNLWALWDAGRLVERLLGNAGFAVAYVASGLAGSLTSVGYNPLVLSAGASGAVFGIYGALVGILVRHRHHFPMEVLKPVSRSAIAFVAYNVAFSFLAKGIDVAAHLGGLGGGLLCGLALSRPLDGTARGHSLRVAVVAVGAAGALALAAALISKGPGAFFAAVNDFQVVEKTAIDRYNAAIEKMRTDRTEYARMADLLEKEVLPPWRISRERLQAVGTLPPALGERRDQLLRYALARENAWSMLASALRAGDLVRMLEAMRKNQEAQAALRDLKVRP